MKKSLLLIVLAIISTLSFAEDIKVRIDIVGDVEPSASKDYVYLIQADRYSAAKDTSDILKMMNENKKVSVWAISPQLGNLSTMQTNVLKGTFIGFHANANTGYTMSFPKDWLSGDIVSIIDHANQDTVIKAEVGTTYHFTVPTTLTDYTTRFEIGDIYAPPVKQICFRYNKLQISGYKGSKVTVLPAAGGQAIYSDYEIAASEVELPVTTVGLYTVQIDENDIFTIQVASSSVSSQDLCEPIRHLFGCQWLTALGTATDTLVAAQGGDSIVTLNLTAHIPDTVREPISDCDSVFWARSGKWYYESQMDTLRADSTYAKGLNCEVVYILTATVGHATFASETAESCDSYEWLGQKYTQSGTYIHKSTNPSGCSHMDTLYLTIYSSYHDTLRTKAYNSFEWRGKTYTQSGLYADSLTTIHGCDSIYNLQLTILPITKVHYPVKDTVCKGDVYQGRLTSHVINGKTTWTDSVRFESGSGAIDSLYAYDIRIYSLYVTDDWTDNITLYCGSAIDVTAQTQQAQAAIASDPLFAPNAQVTWQQKIGDQWKTLSSEPLTGLNTEATLRMVVTSDCGDVISSDKTVAVLSHGPETDPELDGLLAVSKYSDYLLMIHRDSMERELGWEIAPEDVEWYKMLGAKPHYMTDTHVGSGYYYTTARQLVGTFYARVKHAPASAAECKCEAQTRTIFCAGGRVPQMAPTWVRPKENVHVMALNPEVITEVRVMTVDGQTIDKVSTQGETSLTLQAAAAPGYYVLVVEAEGERTVLNYIVH